MPPLHIPKEPICAPEDLFPLVQELKNDPRAVWLHKLYSEVPNPILGYALTRSFKDAVTNRVLDDYDLGPLPSQGELSHGFFIGLAPNLQPICLPLDLHGFIVCGLPGMGKTTLLQQLLIIMSRYSSFMAFSFKLGEYLPVIKHVPYCMSFTPGEVPGNLMSGPLYLRERRDVFELAYPMRRALLAESFGDTGLLSAGSIHFLMLLIDEWVKDREIIPDLVSRTWPPLEDFVSWLEKKKISQRSPYWQFRERLIHRIKLLILELGKSVNSAEDFNDRIARFSRIYEYSLLSSDIKKVATFQTVADCILERVCTGSMNDPESRFTIALDEAQLLFPRDQASRNLESAFTLSRPYGLTFLFGLHNLHNISPTIAYNCQAIASYRLHSAQDAHHVGEVLGISHSKANILFRLPKFTCILKHPYWDTPIPLLVPRWIR